RSERRRDDEAPAAGSRARARPDRPVQQSRYALARRPRSHRTVDSATRGHVQHTQPLRRPIAERYLIRRGIDMRKTVMVVCSLAAFAAAGGAQPARPTPRDSAASDSLFRSARTLLDDRQYRRAANAFASLAELYPATARAGDALYWQAWGLYQLGKDNSSKADLSKALDALSQYNLNYGKNTQMANDATDLYAQIRALQAKLGDANAAVDMASERDKMRQTAGCTGSRADDEMRMAALDGLLSMNSTDAIPILEAVLKQKDPCRAELRKKAVFMIAQKRGSSVVPTLLEVARSDPSTDVRADAIFWLGSSRDDRALPALDSIIFQ